MTGWVLTILLFALPWLPWRPEAAEELAKVQIQVHRGYDTASRPYPAALTYDLVIHWYPCMGDRPIGDLLHESMHYLASKHGMGHNDWSKFARVAMRELKRGDFDRTMIRDARYYLSYGGHELHAELPWLTRGQIPAKLAPWYPWFHFEGQ